ncbi:MAG: ribosome silencing factor [Marinilabiliaceae bacterium]|nr:ribosome silencing factor [Marinilabiliaceae bacterium]
MIDNNEALINSEQLVDAVVFGLQEKKGTDIVILDMRKLENCVTSFFVLCSGESTTHVSAVADSVEEQVLKRLSDKPIHIEGKNNSLWVLLDYVDVVVHVFQRSVRDHYNIESLWADSVRKEIDNLF